MPLNARIVIVEPIDKTFEASSSYCTGCWHYGFPGKETQPLLPPGKYSFELWAALTECETFRKVTGYRANPFFCVHVGNGHGIEALPDLIQRQPNWYIDEDILGPHNATVYVNPRTNLILEKNRAATQQASANG